MTHFQGRRDAFLAEDEKSLTKTATRACTGCGVEFAVRRSWQRQCSPRCRQRTYVQRRSESAIGYYGAYTGKIVRVDGKNKYTDIATGLFLPTGMTFGPDGNLYVSNVGSDRLQWD